jgi:nucleoside-diphosphate-sugar epimerase
MYHTNVTGTSNLVNIALQFPIKKFCHISSIAALGKPKNTNLVHENILWEDSDLNTHYSKSKYLAEVEVWRGQAEGLNTIIFNPSVVIGPSDWTVSSTQLFRYVWKEKTYYTKGSINAVDVRDVANAVSEGLRSQIIGERFILNSSTLPYQTFFEHIAKHFSKKAPYKLVTPWIAGIAWRGAYLLSLISGKAPLISRETAMMAQKSFTYANQKAIKNLNLDFRPLPESIKWTCTELIKRYNLTKIQ